VTSSLVLAQRCRSEAYLTRGFRPRFRSTALVLSIGALALDSSALCQSTPLQPDLSFEVASVRPTDPGPSFTIMEGGLANGRIRYTSMSLRNLLVSAYDVPYDSVVGPAWLEDVRLDIAATFARGTSKEQFRLMLLHLLAGRLGLVAHLGSKLTEGYALVVAKSGPHLERAAAEAAMIDLREPPPPASGIRDEDGFPVLPVGPGVQQSCISGVCRFRATSATMEELADRLPCRCKIVDETHLAGKYKFVLTGDVQWTAQPPRPDSAEIDRPRLDVGFGVKGQRFPDIFHALENQLGLELVRRKVPTPVAYIDRIERVPTEN